MCLATAAVIASVAGAGVSAYGSVQQGDATKSADYYKAEVAKNNQQIAEQNAKGAIEAGEAKAQAVALKGRAIGGAIKARQGMSGVDVNTGSNVDVQVAQRNQSQLDTETTLHNADLEAYGYRTQGTQYQAEAQLDTSAGNQAQTAGYEKAAGGLLSSAGSLGFRWNGMQGPQGPPGPLPPHQPEDI